MHDENKKLNYRKLMDSLPLVWDVFLKYEAFDYPEDGKKAFHEAIHSQEYLCSLTAHGAYENKELVGIIATRNEGEHLALFFVDEDEGSSLSLWNTCW